MDKPLRISYRTHEMPFAMKKVLEKSARDTGFDIPILRDCLHFRCTDSPGEVVLLLLNEYPVAGFKVPPELPPFRGMPISSMPISDIPGFESAEWFQFDDIAHLENALRLYYLENRIKKGVPATSTSLLMDDTEREMLAMLRTRQGEFRNNLMQFWNGRCAISEISLPELLRASHIKPWAVSTPEERLDVYNGLLLNAFADAAFDRGLISFEDSGDIVYSSRLTPTVDYQHLLGSIQVSADHKKYLQYHRANVFQRG